MPRKPRNINVSQFYHVLVQGIKKEFIFDKEIFIKEYLNLLFFHQKNLDINIMAYCIMNNHAHILINTENILNLEILMKKVNQKFAQYYNFKEDRVGHVFRNRYLSEPIEDRKHLLNCLAYIHNNPVKANIVKNCSEYKYSSYNDYLLKKGIATDENIKLLFGSANNYIEEFQFIHNKNTYFLDVDLDSQNILLEELKKIEKEKSIKIKKILEKKEEKNRLIKYLKQINSPKKITAKDIAKILKMTERQVIYTLSKK